MPQVPIYGPRKVDTRPVPGVRRGPAPSPDAYGAQFGETIARIGLAGATDLLQAQRDKADQVRVLEASNQLEAQVQTHLHHPETGVLVTTKGKEAFGLPETVQDWYETTSGDIAGTLSNDRQRLAFARIQAQTRDQVRLQTFSHVDREMQTYADAQAKAGVSLRVSSAIQNWDQPAIVGQKLDEALAITADHLHGQSPAAIAEAKLGVSSAIHGGVIEQMLTTHHDQAAQVYYEETKDQISGEAQTRIEKALEIGSLRGASQRETARILAEGGTPEEMRAKAKAIKDPEVQDETLQRVEHEIAVAKDRQRQAHEDMMTTASQQVFKSRRFDAIPPSLLAQMDDGEITRMKRFAESLQPGGTAIKTDPVTYYDLKRMAADDVEKFKSLDLTTYLLKLGPSDFKEMVDLQVGKRQGKATPELDSFLTQHQILDETLAIAGISTSDTAETRKNGTVKEVAKIRLALDQQVALLQQQTGKKASNADVQQLADDLLKSVVIKHGSWLSILPGGAPFYDVTKRTVDILSDIPLREREAIEDTLRRAGRLPTPENVIQLYRLKQDKEKQK